MVLALGPLLAFSGSGTPPEVGAELHMEDHFPVKELHQLSGILTGIPPAQSLRLTL